MLNCKFTGLDNKLQINKTFTLYSRLTYLLLSSIL